VIACNKLDVKAIVIDTLSGRTARYLASYRGKIPVYAFCYDKRVSRQLALSYGVEAYTMDISASRDCFLKNTVEFLVNEKMIALTDKVVVVAGSFGVSNGASFMEISTAQNLMEEFE
jgi:pyruvate kinase